MRILLINPDGNNISGVRTFVSTIANRLGADVLSMNMESNDSGTNSNGNSWISIKSEESHRVEYVAKIILKWLRKSQAPALIIPNHTIVSNMATFEACKQFDNADSVRVLGIVHSDDSDHYRTIEAILPALSMVLGVSPFIVAKLKGIFGEHSNKFQLLNYPIPSSVPPSLIQQREAPLRIVYSGRLIEHQKRLSRMIRVVEQLVSENISFELEIYGDGPMRAAIVELSQKFGPGQVQFRGSYNPLDYKSIYMDKDIFLLTSDFEGTPISMLEAMACSTCPVVMHCESGIPHTIDSGSNGIIVSPGDVDQMVKAIKQLDRNRHLLLNMQKNASTHISNHHSVANTIKVIKQSARNCFADLKTPNFNIEPSSSTFDSLNKWRNSIGEKPLIFGGGELGKQSVDYLLDNAITPLAIIDSDTAKHGMHYRGVKITGPAILEQTDCSSLLIASHTFKNEILKKIESFTNNRNTPIITPF